MTSTTICPSCSKQLLASPEGRMPPWCRHCGASITPPPQAEALPLAAPVPLGSDGLTPTVDAAPTESCFNACIPGISDKHHRLYRVYVTASDLLVFAIGSGAVSMGEVLPRTRANLVPQAGLAGAVATLAESKQLALAQRVADLDAANEASLREFAQAAGSGDEAFRVGPEDVEWMTLGGPTFWYRWVCLVEHPAVWKFKHRTKGRWALALPGPRDARRAAEWLPRLFPGLVQVDLNWGTPARRPPDGEPGA